MTRRLLREHIFKLLFRIEFNSIEDMQEQCGLYFDDTDVKFDAKDSEYIQKKYEAIVAKKDEIDSLISENAKGWTIDRMSKVDLTIIRLGVYEIKFDDQVPNNVAVNEAIELAKKFGQDESYSFVNGILAKFL